MAPKHANAKRKSAKKNTAKKKLLSAEETDARNRILEDFREFDLNGDGLLQKRELKALLRVLDPTCWTDEAVDKLIHGFDKDGGGDVSLDEFVDWITGATVDAENEAEHDAFVETLGKFDAAAATINRKHAQAELAHIRGSHIETDIQKITDGDLSLIVKLEKPSEPLQRLFSLVWLILQPSVSKAGGKGVSFNPPSWSTVQNLLQDSSFLQRIAALDARRKEMTQTHSMVAAYAVDTFLCVSESESGEAGPAPLSYASILEACLAHKLSRGGQGGPTLVLYKWCLVLLESNLKDLARDRIREQATIECKSLEATASQVKEAEEAAELEEQKRILDSKSQSLLEEAEKLEAEMQK